MSTPKYPLSDPANLETNLSELFERISFVRRDMQPGNIDGYIQENVSVSDTAETTIYHGLGRIPTGVIPIKKSAPCDIYVTAEAEYQITVQSTAVATVTLLIL